MMPGSNFLCTWPARNPARSSTNSYSHPPARKKSYREINVLALNIYKYSIIQVSTLKHDINVQYLYDMIETNLNQESLSMLPTHLKLYHI